MLRQVRAPTRLLGIVDSLFAMPAINVNEVVKQAAVSKPTASSYIARLEKLGILTEYTLRSRERDWVAREIIRVIEDDSPGA